MNKYFIFVILTVLLNALSQILLKKGTAKIGQVEYSANSVISLLTNAALSPYIILGLAVMTTSMCTHILSLSRFDVSFVFPFMSISYVIVMIFGFAFLGENLSLNKIFGISIILLGTLILSRG